ncbi:MAG: hypothetical protein K6G33_02355 [Ruminococcus sp.]|uniref:hypothetical protein n=1 Tax=Ruminococcus sp. TaxID=41978 RepID=UPI0025E53ABB|nr:hypothetical protein [Ruminococcus sp.]MCR5599570.1 hypothetical protein [Ruminococcus sp.]
MKKIRLFEYILAGLAVICILAMVTIHVTRDKEIMRAFFGLPETMVDNICFYLAPFFFGTAALLGFIEKCRNGEKRKALMLSGTIMCYLMVALLIKLAGFDVGSPLKTIKSPDGKHTIYYNEAGDDDEKLICFVRKSFIKYDPVFTMRKGEEADIEWKDDYFLRHGWRYQYPDYEK